MKSFALLVLGGAFVLAMGAPGDEPRPAWDQEKAVAKVKGILALEKAGQPWNRIAWETDPERAAARAKAENKPVLVYFFLKTNVGPKAAPC